MQENVHGTIPAQSDRQAAHMVKMPVADGDHVRVRKPDLQLARVVFEHLSLSRIEEDALAVVFNPERESVFGQQARPEYRVLD